MGKAPPFFGDEVGPSFLCQFWVNHIPILVFLDAILLCACSLLKGQDQYDLWLKILPIKLSFNQTWEVVWGRFCKPEVVAKRVHRSNPEGDGGWEGICSFFK